MSTIFFIFLAILVIGFIGAIVNMVAISKGKLEMKDGFFAHTILMGVVAIGSLGFIITGALDRSVFKGLINHGREIINY